MKKILPILALLLTALPTLARLGETKAECEARYGKPLGTTARSGNSIYLKGGHEIIIGFWNDKAIFLYFTKLKPGTKDSDLPVGISNRVELSEAEMNVLLQANSGTFKWKPSESEDADAAWDLSDGKGYAEYVDRSLEIRYQPALEEWVKDRNLKRAEAIPRLGESKAELEKRCGKPVKTINPDTLAYQKGGFKIVVTFWNDKAAKLRFQSAELYKGPISGNPPPDSLYGDEIKALLKASAGNSEWKQSAAAEDFWNRADKKAHAIYDMDDFVLSIIDEEFSEYETAKDEKEAAAKFKDFGGLGKTKAECEKLYGKPLSAPADGPYAYHRDGIAIIITYWKDKAAKFDFIKIDARAPDADAENREPIYLAERSALLKSFGGGSDWAESEAPEDGKLTWLRKDRKVIAQYDRDEKIFTIYAYDYFLRLTEELDDDETKSLDGF
jgi:hypothetical protein